MTDAKINLVHITQSLEIGGLENFIIEFSKRLDKAIYNVHVLCFEWCDPIYKNTLASNNVSTDVISRRSKFDLSFFVRAASFLRKNNIDIVHIHGGCFFYATIVAKLAGVKSILYTLHGLPVTSGLQIDVEDTIACLFTDKIIAVSDEVAENFISRRKAFKNKIGIIINGVDTDKFRPDSNIRQSSELCRQLGLPQSKLVVGSVGRHHEVKNYPMLLHAVAELIHQYKKDLQLVLAGDGEEHNNLKRLAEELNISRNVSFLGMRYDLPLIYPLFDVFALSSRTEGTSLSLLEAQSCGVPAVVTNVGGNSNIIHDGVNGFLCKAGDHSAMAEKLNYLLDNDSERARMAHSARNIIVDNFNLDSMIAKYQHVYFKCLGRTDKDKLDMSTSNKRSRAN
jgi:L-malate glycosyltransferase